MNGQNLVQRAIFHCTHLFVQFAPKMGMLLLSVQIPLILLMSCFYSVIVGKGHSQESFMGIAIW